MNAKLAALVLLIAATAAQPCDFLSADPCHFVDCLVGPTPTETFCLVPPHDCLPYRQPPWCERHDYDLDGDVDLLDFAEYQIAHNEWQ